MTTSNRFEDKLLVELRQVVAERPAPAAIRSATPRRTRFAMAGAGVAAATAAVAIVATSSDVTPAAYAVEPHSDGSITVEIHSLKDAAGLQSKLRAAGLPAVVDYDPSGAAGCAGPGPRSVRAGGGEAGTGDGPTFSTGGKGEAGGGPTLTQHGAPPAGGDPAARDKVTSSVSFGADGATFTIDPGEIKPGQKMFITTSTGAINAMSVGIGTTDPRTAAC